MRKQYKKKKRSCGMCKPHKRGITNRWKVSERAKRKEDDKEIRNTK